MTDLTNVKMRNNMIAILAVQRSQKRQQQRRKAETEGRKGDDSEYLWYNSR